MAERRGGGAASAAVLVCAGPDRAGRGVRARAGRLRGRGRGTIPDSDARAQKKEGSHTRSGGEPTYT